MRFTSVTSDVTRRNAKIWNEVVLRLGGHPRYADIDRARNGEWNSQDAIPTFRNSTLLRVRSHGSAIGTVRVVGRHDFVHGHQGYT